MYVAITSSAIYVEVILALYCRRLLTTTVVRKVDKHRLVMSNKFSQNAMERCIAVSRFVQCHLPVCISVCLSVCQCHFLWRELSWPSECVLQYRTTFTTVLFHAANEHPMQVLDWMMPPEQEDITWDKTALSALPARHPYLGLK